MKRNASQASTRMKRLFSLSSTKSSRSSSVLKADKRSDKNRGSVKKGTAVSTQQGIHEKEKEQCMTSAVPPEIAVVHEDNNNGDLEINGNGQSTRDCRKRTGGDQED